MHRGRLQTIMQLPTVSEFAAQAPLLPTKAAAFGSSRASSRREQPGIAHDRRSSEGNNAAVRAAADAAAAAASPFRQSLNIAILGAGAAGLVTARELLREGHDVTIYEASNSIGGLWSYDERAEEPLMLPAEDGSTPSLPFSERVHSSMYADLRTNLPREVMGFQDFPMVPEFMGPYSLDQRMYCRHEEVLAYLQAFAERYDLLRHIRFNSRVVHIGAWSSQSLARETSRASLAAFGADPSSTLAAADALSWSSSKAGKEELQAKAVAATTAAVQEARSSNSRVAAKAAAAAAADEAAAVESAEREASFSTLLAARQAQLAVAVAAASGSAPPGVSTTSATVSSFDDLDDMSPGPSSASGAAAVGPAATPHAVYNSVGPAVRRSFSDVRFSSAHSTAPTPTVPKTALLGWPRWAVTSQSIATSSNTSEVSFAVGPAAGAVPTSAALHPVSADLALPLTLLPALPTVPERPGSDSQSPLPALDQLHLATPAWVVQQQQRQGHGLSRQQQQQQERQQQPVAHMHDGVASLPLIKPIQAPPVTMQRTNPAKQAVDGVAAAAVAALAAGFKRDGLSHRHVGGEGLGEGAAPGAIDTALSRAVSSHPIIASAASSRSTSNSGAATLNPFAAAHATATAATTTLAPVLLGSSHLGTSPHSRSLSGISSPHGTQSHSLTRRLSPPASLPGSVTQRSSPSGSQSAGLGKRVSPPGTQTGAGSRRMQSSQDPNNSDSAASTTTYDAVVVAVGNYSYPNVPRITGQHAFPNKQMHSHSYRRPEAFAGQAVLVVGASFSGEDIARDISAHAKTVYVAARTWDATGAAQRPQPWGVHKNLYSRGMVTCLTTAGGASFAWGDAVPHVDTVLYCTGYRYHYPFLHKGVVKVEDGAVTPLFRHIFPPSVAPTLAFVGLLWKSARFPQFELQAKYIARVLSGAVHLPSQQDMEASAAADRQAVLDAGFPLRYLHNQMMAMPVNHEVYDDMLADAAGVDRLMRWRFRMYEEVGKLGSAFPDTYRDLDWTAPGLEGLAALRKTAYAEFASLVDQDFPAQSKHAAQNEWQQQLQQQEQQHNQRLNQLAHHQEFGRQLSEGALTEGEEEEAANAM